jgi:hypothetical protein
MAKKEEFLRENGCEEKEGQVVSRTDFPSDFIFGVATSAYQVRSLSSSTNNAYSPLSISC